VALKYLVEALKWRAEFGTDSIIKDWEATQDPKTRLLIKTFPFGVVAEHEGRPVFLYRFAMVDFPKYFELCGLDYLMRHTVYEFEKIMHLTKRGDAFMIMDLGMTKGFDSNPAIKSIWQIAGWISYLMKYLHPLTNVADPYYPESSYKIRMFILLILIE
jgi:hypothetical protein